MPTGWKGLDYVSGLAATLMSVCGAAMMAVVSVMYFNGFIDAIQYFAFLVILLGTISLTLYVATTPEDDLARESRGLWRKWRELWRGVLK